MDMDNEQVQPSYWNSVVIASLISGILLTVFNLMGGYMTIGSEPSGQIFSPMMLWGTIGCLASAVGGVIVNWHYAKEYNLTYKIGKGALLGLFVAIGATIISVVIGQIWNLIDPSFSRAIMDWNIENSLAMGAPEEAVEGMRGDPNSIKNILYGALGSLVGLAIVNVISGMIGAKIFASEE